MSESICWPENETGYMRIKRKDLSNYITEELTSLIQMWHRITAYGWPQGKGYLAEPEGVREIVELFDREKANYLLWEKAQNGGH
jgi:ubiquinone biosynthesis protein COQ9